MKPKEREYLIVLGAHVRGTELTKALYERVHKAWEYMDTHPSVIAVLSGGRGEGEEMSEARAMEAYLLNKGIAQERLLLEERSTNTAENIAFSLDMIGDCHRPVAVVTNHFHIPRSCAIARKAGCTDVTGIAAPYRSVRLLWYIPREILAYVKDKIYGNL
ncbi:MAG: YdcF family protein [Blautia sp.]|jgi:uncharacterized SAM-binding protein YcdF (DUF218 family)